jgi:plastocyanin domain-containing protein
MLNSKTNATGTKTRKAVSTSIGTKSVQTKFSVSENTQGFFECLEMHSALYEKLYKSLKGFWGAEQAEEFMQQTYSEKSEELYNIIRDFAWDVIDHNLHDKAKPGQI